MIDIRQHDLDRQAAERHQHPREAMRVLMECGHIRLMPQVDTVQGIGSLTGCAVCVPEPGRRTVERLVVDVQETGRLFYDTMYRPRVKTWIDLDRVDTDFEHAGQCVIHLDPDQAEQLYSWLESPTSGNYWETPMAPVQQQLSGWRRKT